MLKLSVVLLLLAVLAVIYVEALGNDGWMGSWGSRRNRDRGVGRRSRDSWDYSHYWDKYDDDDDDDDDDEDDHYYVRKTRPRETTQKPWFRRHREENRRDMQGSRHNNKRRNGPSESRSNERKDKQRDGHHDPLLGLEIINKRRNGPSESHSNERKDKRRDGHHDSLLGLRIISRDREWGGNRREGSHRESHSNEGKGEWKLDFIKDLLADRKIQNHRHGRRDGHHLSDRKEGALAARDPGEVADSHKEPKRPSGAMVGKKNIGEFLPDMDWATPWMRGHLQVGPSISMSWDMGDVFGGRKEKWWEGPNVCSMNEETEKQLEQPDIRTHHAFASTVCDETDSTYKCTTTVSVHGMEKTYTTKFECCHGFRREPGAFGCTEELQLTTLLTTINSLNLTELHKALTSVGLEDLLKNGNFTIFAPSDEAFVNLFPQLINYESGEYSVVEVSAASMNLASQLQNVLATHVIEGFYNSNDLDDEMMLTTANPKAKIRINKFEIPKRIMTANCQPIISSDNLAINGVIHTLDEVLQPVELTLTDIISKDDQLSTLKTILAKTGMSRDLGLPTGKYTLFAPTNDAFAKLSPGKLDKLLASENCLRNVLKQHLLPHIICSGVIQGHVRTFNSLNNFLHFNSTKDGKVFVEQAQVTRADVMGTNGVLHIIDDVLIPDDALDLLDVAEKAEATKFLELVKSAGLSKTLQQSDNVTVFVPTNEAIQKLSNETLQQLIDDKEALSKILKYHIVTDEISGHHLLNDRKLDTLDSNKKILLRDFSSFPFSIANVKTAQCAPISKVDLESCNGRIHLVDKVLLPPKGDVLDVLAQDSRFTTLVGLLKKSGMAEELQLSGPFTFFAPTNKAFSRISADVLERLSQSSEKDKLKQLLKHHVMYDSLCCSGVFQTHWTYTPKERMLDGSTVLLSKKNEEVLINSIEIKTCDMTATNGVVHAIDDIIPDAVEKYGGVRSHYYGHRHHRTHGNGNRKGSRLRNLFGGFKLHVSDFFGKMDDMEWEFEWPSWTKDVKILKKIKL